MLAIFMLNFWNLTHSLEYFFRCMDIDGDAVLSLFLIAHTLYFIRSIEYWFRCMDIDGDAVLSLFIIAHTLYFTRSIEYWFRCMDIDGNGVLSMFELEYFYEEQVAKMEALGIETMAFNDCLCQVRLIYSSECFTTLQSVR